MSVYAATRPNDHIDKCVGETLGFTSLLNVTVLCLIKCLVVQGRFYKYFQILLG